MQEALLRAVEKLNSDVRNYLTPILAYADLLSGTASEADRKKLATVSNCAEQILASLNEFVASVTKPSPGFGPPSKKAQR